eukprot:CAMPEP_0195125870 /NCGR_PEP_ID=MMETSP0448-20130528/133826_1 /TAXON_ID=66468 /ORGANISM="Heterocapsa triquestra, Strain CCMP 448" /LENGTH=147 /DNA_ID=CAMNT_0040163535 /DNA_START=21 /DNA_END=464 /DNA_ORIENTATION=+
MTLIFIMNLFTVVVLLQQMFMTYRLLTTGPTGFEVAKSYYLNPNITTLRHTAIKMFFIALPLFVAGQSCMVIVNFSKSGSETNMALAWPIVVFLILYSLLLCWINNKQQAIFKDRYAMAKHHDQPLLNHLESMSSRNGSSSPAMVDV